MTPESPAPASPFNPRIPSNWAAKWTADEDMRLKQGIEQYGEQNWKAVAEVVGTRDQGTLLRLSDARPQ